MLEKTLQLLEFDKVRKRLADHTAFGGGRELALGLRPAFERVEVIQRLARTTQARAFLDRREGSVLEGAHDMRLEVEAAERGRMLLGQELLEIRDTLAAGRRLKRPIMRDASRWPALAELGERLDPCPAVHDAIDQALEDGGELRDDASPELARLRREIKIAEDRLMRKLEQTLRGNAATYLQESLITQREGRYVVPVKADFRGKVPGVVHDVSDSGQTVFVEPMAAVEPGNELRQMVMEERKEVERILRRLSGVVAAEADALAATIDVLAALDLCFAAARLGARMQAVTPELAAAAEPPALRYDAARHPLLDAQSVVPIDVRVGDDGHIVVITGPNTGGKTVALKTTGLLTLMAQAGLQVPAADGASLSVFDGVYADIGDEQSIEQSLSTFSGHMTNIIAILERAGPRSLVLLDELGAGTDPSEGAALAGAILEVLREGSVTTLASTHFTELKSYAHTTEDVVNASVEFDVETLRPTYELTIGLPGRSNALAIAERLGLPVEIIERARSGLAIADVEMEDLLAEIQAARREARADRLAASERKRKADAWAAKLEHALRDIEQQRAELLNEARRQAEAEIAAARKAIAKLVERAEAAGSDEVAALQAQLDAEADELQEIVTRREEAEPAPEPLPELSALLPGARVRVRSLDREAEVLTADEDGAEVQMGPLRMRVDPDDMVLVSEAPAEPTPRSEGRHHVADVGSDAAPMEIDLRGMRVEEALHALDGHLDRALLVGTPFLRVIHGHGTGALKKAVRDTLRGHPAVTSYRRGERGEGGDGATVVTFD